MPIENPKYDVAISFLSRDQATAAAINQKLSEGLQVFFFPRSQEELAATDGLESMRTPFFDDSRVMVVLYREEWGKTPWTGVEETAIKEACLLKHGWNRLFFVVLNQADALPIWLPQNYVRFNFVEYGLEQAIGAIKARAQENGGQHQPLTAMKRAEMHKADELFRQDKSQMGSQEGIRAILKNVAQLVRHIEKGCADINAKGHLDIRFGSSATSCIMTDEHVGIIVAWNQQYSNSLVNSFLTVREYGSRLILQHEIGHRTYVAQPEVLDETQYSPDLSLAREYGWKRDSGSEFLSSDALAEQCIIQFINLANRHACGEIRTSRTFNSFQ